MKKIKACIFLLIFLTLIPQVQAIGSLQKSNFAKMEKGETIEFTVLLWNLENPYFIKIEPKTSDNFIVFAIPNEFILNKSSIGPPYENAEYVSLPSGDVKAFPVKILVKALEETKAGSYEIPISIRAESLEGEIKVAQEKTLIFKINVTGFEKEEMKTEEKPLNKTEPKLTAVFSLPEIDYRYFFIALFIIIILAISFLIYKFV